MRLYIFKSDSKRGLQAFAGDISGSRLPDQFAPWTVVGIVGHDKNPPHNFPRDQIERAIGDCGFQLWRVKPKTTSD